MCSKITYYISFVFLLFPVFGNAQVVDNFSDGDFTNTPTWSGNDTDFIVNASQRLQLNSSGTSASYLVTPNTQALNNCEWNFWISQTFSPSSGNNARVYLVSDQPNITGSLNGYYLQFGESLSNDQVELFKQTGATSTSVCRGTTLIANSFVIRVKVTRDNTGLWKLFIDPTGGTGFFLEASGTDNTFSSTSSFGIFCTYTSSNATKFYFDDFYVGPIILDTIPPQLLSASALSSNTVQLFFNEPMDSLSLLALSAYSIDNGIGIPASVMPVSPNFSSAILTLLSSLVSGTIYTVTVSSAVKDKAGNGIGSANNATFAIVEPASANALVVNEIMFDPFTNGVEWVEIYNRSDKVLDLKKISICNMDASGNFTNTKQIAPNGFLMFPKDYLVLSKDQSAIKTQYNTTNTNGFIDMTSFISLSNDSAYVVLIDTRETVIDKLQYRSDWHLPLLPITKGISIERINYDSPTQGKNNWHSAAESVGGATPAYKNSQYTDGVSGNEITISPEVFSPDNDGYNDVLSISYVFDSPGMIGNVQIYDSRGRLTKTLVRNELLATYGTFFWDGITDDKMKARIGIYIIYVEAFDDKGKVKNLKKSCVVGGKF